MEREREWDAVTCYQHVHFYYRIYSDLVAMAPSVVQPAPEDGKAQGSESVCVLKFIC